ncbi:MAG TPA: hypothetical protein G4O09_00780 [Dehalococcoidia bacterium]|nr:hypothetical protein [Dehalococcoidia bacterium]
MSKDPVNNLRFMVDSNVGKLARWLRMMGYDTRFFNGGNDAQMVREALDEDRVILTRDTQIVKRRVVTTGQLKVVLVSSDDPRQQMRQVIASLKLGLMDPFSVCLECNRPLEERSPSQVKDLVPPYVFQTQREYMECPACHRIYWRGTHWQAMTRQLRELLEG